MSKLERQETIEEIVHPLRWGVFQRYLPRTRRRVRRRHFVGHESGLPEPVRGRDGLKELLETYRSGFPDLSSEVVESCAKDDTVAVRWIMRGTHEGDVLGIEPTGKRIEVERMEFNRVKDEKIVETHINYDALGMLRQIDALPDEFAA